MMSSFLSALRPARRILTAAVATAAAGATVLGSAGTAGPVGTGAPAAPAEQAPTVSVAASAYPAMSSDEYERRVQKWINVRRGQHGLGQLRLQSCTENIAERWGSYLASNDEFYHQSMGKILDKCNAYYAGETLGRGAISPKRLVYLWMHSSAHRAVLLSKHPRRVGIGAYPDRHGQWVVAADFTKF